MRKTNPWSKFFLSNLYPFQGEVGNAFWGYHVANDIGRLLNIDGTVFVGPFDWSLYQNGQIAYRQFDIPIESFQFNAAPIVQVWAYSDTISQTVTTDVDPTQAKVTRLRLETDVNESSPTMDFFAPEGEDDISGIDLSGKMISVAESFAVTPTNPTIYTEKILVKSFTVYKKDGWIHYSLNVNRGEISSIQQYYYQDERLVLMDGAFTTRITNIVEPTYELWPAYVEAFLDQNKLRIRWMLDGGGTVYFKIFGA